MIQGVTKQTTVPKLICFVYGPTKSGKTTMAGSFPKPLFIACDRLPNYASLKREIPYIIPENSDELIRVIEEIAMGTRGMEYDSIILDSISEASNMLKADILKTKEALTIQDWGKIYNKTQKIVTLLTKAIGIRKHVCVLARVKVEKDEVLGGIVGLPELNGSYSHAISSAFDFVFFSEQRETKEGKLEWILHTRTRKNIYPAGDGMGGFLAAEEVNNFDIIYNKIVDGYASI